MGNWRWEWEEKKCERGVVYPKVRGSMTEDSTSGSSKSMSAEPGFIALGLNSR